MRDERSVPGQIKTRQGTRQQYVADRMDQIAHDFGPNTEGHLCMEAAIMLRSAEKHEAALREAERGWAIAGEYEKEVGKLRSENATLRALVVEVGNSGIEYDFRKYVVIQIDPETFAECRRIARMASSSAPGTPGE